MQITDPLEFLVIISGALLIGFYGIYGGLCRFYANRTKSNSTPIPLSNLNLPTISIIVPTYNEASEVGARIDNLNAVNYDHDRLQVVFVDGGSSDGTTDIIEQRRLENERFVLIKQKRREGYNKAIMDGFNSSSGELISITGAEVEFEPNALLHVVKHFSAENVGAVTGRMKVREQAGLSPKLEKAYRNMYDLIGAAESSIDSTWDVKGELNAARRSVVKEIIEHPGITTTGCVDTCFSFQARMLGLKTVYEPEAAYFENAPTKLWELIEQRVRRARVHIQSMLLYRNVLFNPRYGKFGLLIGPAHFAMLVVLPFVFALLVMSLALLILVNPLNPLTLGLGLAGLTSVAVSPHAQAFTKNQLCLIMANLGLLAGFDDQRFKRLLSTRSVGNGKI